MAVLRALTEADLPHLLDLSLSAHWNQLEQDWRNLLRLAPEGCFGIEEDGRVTACATGVTYANELAWIGMVLTLPDYRGRGHASKLMQHLLNVLDVPCIKLDATDLGRPVYEKFGFVEEYVVERWKGQLPLAPAVQQAPDLALDREAFGAGRAALLEVLGTSRPGRVANYVGPLVCRTREEARSRVLSSGASGTVFWDIPLPNMQAVELATQLGFAPVRRLWRMRRGTPIQERPDLVYALAGFEWG